MSMTNRSSDSEARYGRIAALLHWAIAFFIAANLVLGFVMYSVPLPYIGIGVALHISMGLTVLVLSVVRVFWRVLNPPPPFLEGTSTVEKLGAKLAHFLLYCLMIVLPLTGWGIVSANPPADMRTQLIAAADAGEGEAVPPRWRSADNIRLWFVAPVPMIKPIVDIADSEGGVEPQEVLHDEFHHWHELLAYIMIALLALHIGGAVKHQFMDRHPIFRRMSLK